METHVIVGAGQVGSATALLLAQDDRRVLLVSRSGSGSDHPNIEKVAAAGDRYSARLLEVGCGTGTAVREAAGIVTEVVSLDLSPASWTRPASWTSCCVGYAGADP